MEELPKGAEKFAEEVRIAREQVLGWTREVQMECDEGRERKSKRLSERVNRAIRVVQITSGCLATRMWKASWPRRHVGDLGRS